MTTVEVWHNEALGVNVCTALGKNGFEARYVSTAPAALEAIADFVQPGMSVGFGGSMTLDALGAREKVRSLGARVLDHNAPGIDEQRKLEVRRAQLTCDLFLPSSNAVTLEGEIVNVDGGGNRVAALTFGPKKTVVVGASLGY